MAKQTNKNSSITYTILLLLEEANKELINYIESLYGIFAARNVPFEIIIIANGTENFLRNESTTFTALSTKFPAFEKNIHAFALQAKVPQAVALKAGFKECRGKIIVVCGSYQQITTASFENLLNAFDEESNIASPWRQNRVDPSFNQLQSRIFNWLVNKITKSNIHDLSCTVKIFRREVLEDTELYGNMYRFLPLLAAKKGLKTKEVKCEHREEKGETGFYSFKSYMGRLLDIATLYFNTRFSKKPLRFFSILGSLFLAVGVAFGLYVFFQKIFLGYPIGGQPFLILGLLFIVLGVQAASVGLLGEIIVFTQGRQKKEYTIAKII